MGQALQLQITLALLGACLLFLLEMALSIVLVAATELTPVALRRLSSECGPRFAFLEELQDGSSVHRTAPTILRQLALIAGTLLVVYAARKAGLPYAGVAGFALGALLGVLLLEAFLARALALYDPRAALRRTAFLVPAAQFVLFPVVRPLHRLLERFERAEAPEEQREEQQEEEVEAYLEVGEREGILEASESKMMRSIVDLDETPVREIMTPRTDIVALPLDVSVAQARRTLVQAGHSRVPVYREVIDNIEGILYARDLLKLWDEGRDNEPIADHLREVMFVPETLSVAGLLAEMRVKTHIAMVVDEYGGLSGLVTLEDLLEEIVGDIRDEYEREEALVREERDGSWVVDASAHVEELEQLFDVDFGERDFDTVGGLVISGFGRVPAAGESLDTRGLHIEVLKADPRRIHLVRVRMQTAPHEARAGR